MRIPYSVPDHCLSFYFFSPNIVADFLLSQISVVLENTPAIVPKKVTIPSTEDNNFVLKIAFIYKIRSFGINNQYILIPYLIPHKHGPFSSLDIHCFSNNTIFVSSGSCHGRQFGQENMIVFTG